ncbi:MAG: lipopolysaccharide ABC transporter ATP-binding protein, partial [Gammaproteobacteria bacterium]|nr:lipopolysaccharide ABC transporter ATP-binding protein [Gammaproteobacteria bacterium]
TLGICERAYILSEGKVILEGRPEDVLANKRVREVYLGEDFQL